MTYSTNIGSLAVAKEISFATMARPVQNRPITERFASMTISQPGDRRMDYSKGEYTISPEGTDVEKIPAKLWRVAYFKKKNITKLYFKAV
ncbi:MAG: hypothetical protein JSS75_07065 [Bacteroidetes bacterium]|nr:hypothetical protein [Bacteroidota bacterium]